MKTIFKKIIFVCIISLCAWGSNAQTHPDHNYWQFSPRVGYDFPTVNNDTPYIDYNGGLELGVSLDYYWTWFGLGFDFDYIKNSPESTFPTDNLVDFNGGTLTDFSLTEESLTRTFYGIGPNAQYVSPSGKFKAELNLRGGISSVKGGLVALRETAVLNDFVNYHAGYDAGGVFATKAQMRYTYFFNDTFGIHAGAYYLRHYGVEESVNSGIAAQYYEVQAGQGNSLTGSIYTRDEACAHDISSVGVFAGITIKLKPQHNAACCTTCGCSVTVTAKDKFTGQVLPETDVVLADLKGNVVQSATTNSYGVVVFSDVTAADYIIKGKLYEVALEQGSIAEKEFDNCQDSTSGIQKEILYTDSNFILKGSVTECNTTTGIQGVDIQLQDKIRAGQKNTLSNAKGNFIFNVQGASTYGLKGQKDGYFSNEVTLNTSSYDRNNTLFIDFEMCIDPCGVAIKLENINFDLDKAIILPQSRPDLDYVVQLMKDNPSITVELSSHTDSQGGDSYNQELSQRRADASVQYIVSKGIAQERLIARGAGETELKNTKCKNGVPCTDQEHRVNRRTEFKIICF